MTLDPDDWPAFRRAAHELLDVSIDKVSQARDGRVWTPVPEDMKVSHSAPLPRSGVSDSKLIAELASMMPYGPGNTHPRFFGWVQGAGTTSGLLADMVTGAMNVNAGGRNHISPVIEQQVIRWSADMMGLPETTSGLLVSGTSMATVVAMKVARDQAIKQGAKLGQMTGYTSVQTHSCVARAFDLLGIGTENLRRVECGDDFQIDLLALEAAIKMDQANGLTPFAIIGTAGAVNMGAIDDLEALADMSQTHNMWFHIDGAFGATANIGTHARARLTGLSRADSIAFDYHKWLQVNYEAGCVLIRNSLKHRASYSDRPDYLRSADRGLAGGDYWAVDHGPELSRSFRSLKVWAHLKQYGTDALAAVIDRNIEQAQYLETLVERSNALEMLAPVPLNICCFRYKFSPADNDRLNLELVVRLQEDGAAVTSTTRIRGELAIRVNITNHRTRQSDLDLLVAAIERIGKEIKDESAPHDNA